MAEPEIKIGVQADISQALQDIDKLGGTCERNAAKLEGLSFEELSNQYAQLASLCAEMGKNAEQVQAFGDRLLALQRTQSDGVDAFDRLADTVREMQTQLANGTVTMEEARTQYAALKDENLKLYQAGNQLNFAKKELAKETERNLEQAQREIGAYRELNEAAKKELQTVEEAGVKKAQARDREKASIKELEQALQALDAKINDARKSGHTVGELAGVKEQLAIIDAIEKKIAVQQKADAAAQARIDNIRRSAELEVASIDQISAKIKELQAAYKNARQTGDKQGELQYLQQMKQAFDVKKQKLAEEERAQKTAAQAMEQAAAAAKKQAAEEAAAAEKVRMSAMTVRQLSKEVRDLTAARRAAANAGDAQAVAAYTAKIKQARTALRDLKNEANLAKTALLGKAQAGMTAAQQLGGLAQQVRSGEVDMASFANTIMGVGVAIQAGLGPIGWAMLAIQGLQMAINAFSDSQNEAALETMEANKQAFEAWNRQRQELLALSKKHMDTVLDNMEGRIDKAYEAASMASQDAAREAGNALKKEQAAAETRHHLQQIELQTQRDRVQTQVKLGELTREEGEARIAALNEELRLLQANYEKEQQDRTVAAARGAQERAAQEADAMQEAFDKEYGKWQKVINWDAPDMERLTYIQAQLQRDDILEDEAKELQKEFQSIIDSMWGINGELEEMLGGVDNEKGWEGVLEYILAVKKQAEEKKKAIDNQRREAAALGEAADQAEAAVVENDKRRASDTLLAQEREASRRLQQAHEAYMKESLDDMQKVVKNWKTIGSYAAKSAHLSEEQTLLQDQFSLQQRRYELETILGRELDEQTRQKITAQLDATNQEIQGLCAAMGRAKRAAERWLRELEPPDIKGKNKAAQSAIKRLSKGYQRAAQRAEKAARSGNEKQQAMAERSLDRYARAMSRNAKHAGEVDELQRQTKDKLEIIKRGVTKQAASTTRAASASSQTATSTAADMAAVTSAAQSVTTAQETTSAQIDQLGRVFTDMASATNRSADSIERLASIVAAALDNLEKRVAAAEQKVQRLETRV